MTTGTGDIARARRGLAQAQKRLNDTVTAAKADGVVSAKEQKRIQVAKRFVALKETNLSQQQAERALRQVRRDAFQNVSAGKAERAEIENAHTKVERLQIERLKLRAELGLKGGTELVISSFNVTGSSHTGPGSTHPELESGVKRMRYVADLMKKHKVDIMGFQELQPDQLKAFGRLTDNRYGVYPGFKLGRRESANSIAWDKKKWELVKPGSIQIPYFNGNKRPMPVVLLKNKQTGQKAYFVNVHNPADTKTFHHQEKYRDAALALQAKLVNRLEKTGVPVFLTGDMNENQEYYRGMTRRTEMESAHKGPNGPRSNQTGIDWIFGSNDVVFSDYERDRSRLVRKTTNHPMVVTKARIKAGK